MDRGSGSHQTERVSGPFILFREMIYSGFISGSVCHFSDPFSRLRENCVHRTKKYCFKRLFSKNNPFNQDLSLLFIGLRLATYFAP
jgi:hypothetical protein